MFRYELSAVQWFVVLAGVKRRRSESNAGRKHKLQCHGAHAIGGCSEIADYA